MFPCYTTSSLQAITFRAACSVLHNPDHVIYVLYGIGSALISASHRTATLVVTHLFV